MTPNHGGDCDTSENHKDTAEPDQVKGHTFSLLDKAMEPDWRLRLFIFG